MKHLITMALAMTWLSWVTSTSQAQGQCGSRPTCADRQAAIMASYYSWHGDYYHVSYGAPVALVVPPTAGYQTDYHWGVAGTRVTPIYHQFRRGYPGIISPGGGVFRGTPRWPSDTNQFGVYYVRAPW